MSSQSTRLVFLALWLWGAIGWHAANALEPVKNDPQDLGTVPKFIRGFMSDAGCAPIISFYSDHIVENPPFAATGGGGYAYLCEKKSADVRTEPVTTYALIKYETQNKSAFAGCPDRIDLKEKPGGLVLSEIFVEKGKFTSLRDRNAVLNKQMGRMPALAVADRMGGSIEFVCVGNTWYYGHFE